MQELSDAEVAARGGIAPSDTVRVRFGEIDGLRALAVVMALAYEATRFASPGGHWPPVLGRAFADASQGLSLFFLLSGFVLAYPIFATFREDGRTYLDTGRYFIKRALRIYPAYLVVLALTFAVPPLAMQYGLPALATGSGAAGWPAFFANAFFAGSGLDNDGFRVLALEARWSLLFPLLALLWHRAPRVSIGAIALLALADALTGAGHALGLGSLVPFMLGIVAADVRAGHHRIERFGFALGGGALVAALLAEPFLAMLGGNAAAPGALRIDPLWSLAFFGLLLAAGTSRVLERILSLGAFRLLGAASYGIALVMVPVCAFVVRQVLVAVGPGAAAANALLVSAVAGFVVWQIADRWFAEGNLRRELADRIAPLLDAALRPLHADRVIFGAAPEMVAEGVDETPVDTAFYAPPPRPASGDVAIVSTRSGSADDLAAEIMEMKKRLSDRSAAIFADAQPAAEPLPEPPPPPEVPHVKPGFYRKSDLQQRVAVSPAPPAPAPAFAPAATHEHYRFAAAPPATAPDRTLAPVPPSTRGPIKMRLAPMPNQKDPA